MKLLDQTGDMAYRWGSFNVSISGTRGLLESLIKNKQLTYLVLDGRINWQGLGSRQFANGHYRGNYPQYSTSALRR